MKQNAPMARHIPCTHTEYHARPELSNSQFTMFLAHPALYHGIHIAKTIPPVKPTEAMQLGTAFHESLLIGDDQEIWVEIPDDVLSSAGHRRGKVWQEWQEDNADKIQLSSEQAGHITGAIRSVFQHRDAVRILDAQQHIEHSIVWQDHRGIDRRARIDVVSETCLADIKTTRDASYDGFRNSARRLGYFRQARWYQEALGCLTGEVLPFFFIAVELSAPYRVEVYEVGKDFAAIADAEIEAGLARFQRCQESGVWQFEHHGSALVLEPAPWDKPNILEVE